MKHFKPMPEIRKTCLYCGTGYQRKKSTAYSKDAYCSQYCEDKDNYSKKVSG